MTTAAAPQHKCHFRHTLVRFLPPVSVWCKSLPWAAMTENWRVFVCVCVCVWPRAIMPLWTYDESADEVRLEKKEKMEAFLKR